MEAIPERREPFWNESASLAIFYVPTSGTKAKTDASMLPTYLVDFSSRNWLLSWQVGSEPCSLHLPPPGGQFEKCIWIG